MSEERTMAPAGLVRPDESVVERTGNAREVRRVLAAIADWLTKNGLVYGYTEQKGRQLKDWAEKALLKPPRNCDVGTAEEQADRFFRFCIGHQSQIKGMCDFTCPCTKEPDKCHCLTKWAQMPYTETKEKGGEA